MLQGDSREGPDFNAVQFSAIEPALRAGVDIPFGHLLQKNASYSKSFKNHYFVIPAEEPESDKMNLFN